MRHEPADAEAAMWRLLRDRRLSAFKFRRQVPFKTYILDFVCFAKHLVIEIDGSQHVDSQTDAQRQEVLASEGFRTARYWNNDV
jgi:very-short-patch-repair endonuclease